MMIRRLNDDLVIRLCQWRDAADHDYQFVQALITRFIEETVADYTFTVRTEIRAITEPDDDTAFVTFDGSEFVVVIEELLCLGSVWDYLIHEFAHVGTWFVNEYDDHGPHFGVEYARLYNIYLELYAKWYE